FPAKTPAGAGDEPAEHLRPRRGPRYAGHRPRHPVHGLLAVLYEPGRHLGEPLAASRRADSHGAAPEPDALAGDNGRRPPASQISATWFCTTVPSAIRCRPSAP